MEIVFVHLNSRIPIHLYMNLRRTTTLFPEETVTLISNRNQKVPRGIKVALFEKKTEWLEVESRLKHPKNFRNNFWMTSLGRFIALAEYQSKTLGPILHIESDVIISKDFPLKVFRDSVSQISFPVLSLDRGIASILFLPHVQASKALLDQVLIASQNDAYTSDMLVLGNLFTSDNQVTPLPIGPELKSNYRNFTPEKLFMRWGQERSKFGGVFDGWDIGGFYFGTDPRNARGRSIIQRDVPSEFADVRKWKLKFSKERNFIGIDDGEEITPVFSLHLTSKQLNLFRVQLPRSSVTHFLTQRENEYSIFYKRIFLHQASLALIRRIRFVQR